MPSKLIGTRIFDVEASGACNLACPFCPRELLPPVGHMSMQTFTAFLDHVPLRKADVICFCGIGEPTLNRQLPDFIRLAKLRCPQVDVNVMTNGTRLNERVLPSLIEAGLDALEVSFNGLDRNSYERMMKGASFDEVLANLEYTIQAIRRMGAKTQLKLNFILARENETQEQSVTAFWRQRGIEHVRVQRMHDRAGVTRVEGMTPVDAPGLRRPSCDVFEMITFITWQGDVIYCCHDIPRTYKIGTIHLDAWDDLERKKQEIIRSRNWPSICAACTDPLRHDLRDRIDWSIRTTIKRRVLGAAGLPFPDSDDAAGGRYF